MTPSPCYYDVGGTLVPCRGKRRWLLTLKVNGYHCRCTSHASRLITTIIERNDKNSRIESTNGTAVNWETVCALSCFVASSKYELLNQCRLNVGPALYTIIQHWACIGCVCSSCPAKARHVYATRLYDLKVDLINMTSRFKFTCEIFKKNCHLLVLSTVFF